MDPIPASGSVRPKHPITSPLAIRGSHSHLLFLAAVGVDREHRKRTLDADGAPEPGVTGLELEAGEAIARAVRAGAAVALEVHPEDTELAELAEQLARERPGLIPVGDPRQDAVGDPASDRVADEPFLVAEQRIDLEEIRGSQRARDG